MIHSRNSMDTDGSAGYQEGEIFVERPRREEIANALTHGIATAVAGVASIWLISRAWRFGDPVLIAACSVYAVTLVSVFYCSTMSHWVTDHTRRTLFRQLDQGFIYLLIIGTLTPFLLAYFPGRWSSLILVVSWLIAIAGFASKVFFAHRVNRVSVVGYIALGWIPAMAAIPSGNKAPLPALLGILAGGILYTTGTYFLYNDRRYWYYHAVWHLFVFVAAGVHFATMLTLFHR